MVKLTIRQLMPYMDDAARQAVERLVASTGKDIDELMPDEILAEVECLRGAPLDKSGDIG